MGQYVKKDYYYSLAKENNLMSRSVFKLREIDEQFQLVRPNYRILDLGCSPGGWIQYVLMKLQNTGTLVGVDKMPLNNIDLNSRIEFIHGNIFLINDFKGPFDLILSDISPKLCGIKDVDQYNCFSLNKKVILICLKNLKTHGNFCIKIFENTMTEQLINLCKKFFQHVLKKKLKSTRKASAEMYLVALNKLEKNKNR